MTLRRLALEGLRHYWRTNLAVVAGVAIAVAVLAGALIVGVSVKTSLRELAVGRLGRTDHLVASAGFFRADLARELAGSSAFSAQFADAVGLIAVDGLVERDGAGPRVANVAIYGVDGAFWRFHQRPLDGAPPTGREALVSPALARELGASSGDGLLVRLRQPSAIPAATLHGRRDELGRTIRVSLRAVLPVAAMGEFSLRAQQGEVRAVFLPLDRLQRDLNQAGRVNALLVAARSSDAATAPATGDRTLAAALGRVKTLADSALRLRRGVGGDERAFALESDSGLLTERVAARARAVAVSLRLEPVPVFAYLARTIRIEDREVPYSVVAGLDLDLALRRFPMPPAAGGGGSGSWGGDPKIADPIWLNAWTATALGARVGDRVQIDYEVWDDGGGVAERAAEFTLAGVLPMRGLGADRTLTPDYPGISDQTTVADWDPPFPLDLSRINPRDEQYWRDYRAAPKAFIPYEVGERLWASRFGRLTSMRMRPDGDAGAGTSSDVAQAFAARLDETLTVDEAGFLVQPVRARAIEASSGTTDFGEYFLYFSFFIVISGLLLTGLFFRVGIEQRLREIGLLEAIGLTPRAVRGLFLLEGFGLALAGSLLGLLGALAYAAIIMLGLRTWWVGAVGTTALTLRPSPAALAIGLVGGVLTALAVVAWTLRQVARAPARSLLRGVSEMPDPPQAGVTTGGRPADRRRRRAGLRAALMLVLTGLLLVSSLRGVLDSTAGFFGAGAAALATALFALGWWLRRDPAPPRPASARRALTRAGLSNASVHPGRSVLSVALIAFATFVIVAVGAFRREQVPSPSDPRSGTGGYAIMAEAVAPLMYDPATPAGRAAYGFDSPEVASSLGGVSIDRFRLRPGDDGSCLNLYRPENPRILAPTPQFVARGGRFAFAASLAETETERANPWLLLNRNPDGGAVPAIVDATSLAYVFHKSLGDEIVVARPGEEPLRLLVVATLSHSLFQSEVVIGEPQFVRLFPQNEGYRVWLVSAPSARVAAIAKLLQERLSDFGVETSATAERLMAYQRVENTYLSTFQALGALGLVLGTLGLGAVLLRNILERQREVALLQAVGYGRGDVRLMIVAETALLVAIGLAIGIATALLAVQPALADQGGGWPLALIAGVVGAVGVAGLLSSLAAARVALRLPLIGSLRAE